MPAEFVQGFFVREPACADTLNDERATGDMLGFERGYVAGFKDGQDEERAMTGLPPMIDYDEGWPTDRVASDPTLHEPFR